MFSIIIATHDSERALVPTLAALVPGATAGIVREVIVADGGSRDETEQVADIAGCRFLVSAEPLGARLKAAAATARGDWLMFLHPGVVPGSTWIDEAFAFVEKPATTRAPRCFAGEGRTCRSAALRRHSRPRPAAGPDHPQIASTTRSAGIRATPQPGDATCCAASGGAGSSRCAPRIALAKYLTPSIN